MISRTLSFSGLLQMKVKRAPGPGLAWHLRNRLRRGYLWGWFVVQLARLFSKLTGVVTITSQLSIRLRKATGEWIDYGVVGYRVITDTGVGFIVDAWQNSVEIEIMKYHGCGTGVGAEAAGNTALGTECTTALNPDSTRATGTLAEGASANIFSSVGTLTFDASAAVTEHGLLSQAATGGGVLWDRTVFAAVNVASGDQIQFTYQATLTSGG
jgi:hypothetical protein